MTPTFTVTIRALRHGVEHEVKLCAEASTPETAQAIVKSRLLSDGFTRIHFMDVVPYRTASAS